MSQLATSRPLRIQKHGETIPYITLPTSRLEAVRNLLDEHDVDFWMDEVSITINDEPEFTVLNLPGADPSHVQKLLDSLIEAP